MIDRLARSAIRGVARVAALGSMSPASCVHNNTCAGQLSAVDANSIPRSRPRTCVMMLPLLMLLGGCAQSSDALSETTTSSSSNLAGVVTGRISMGATHPNQCGMAYSGSEKVNGYWIAGVDGATFGSLYDGQRTSACGQLVCVNGTQFIIADRIWENDGVGGSTYNNKSNADRKVGGTGAGYTQIDIAAAAFYSVFGGNNANATIQMGSCSGGSASPGDSQAPSANNGCDYSKASANNGWGWNPTTRQSCPPQGSNSGSSGGGSAGGCDYSKASANNGWGWNPTTRQSCPPEGSSTDSSGGASAGGCDYSKAFANNGWGWNPTTKQSCPPL